MKWVAINDRVYNLSHILEFHWNDGALRIRLLGCSVPDIIPDPDQVHWRGLVRIVEGGVPGGEG